MADIRRRAEMLVRKIAEAKEALDKLDKITVAELLRRGEETSEIDGYGRGQDGESRSSVGDHSDPTLSAVMARESDTRADPIAEAIEDICARIVEMHGHARVIDRKRQVVLNAASRLRGRVVIATQCQACDRDVECTSADPISSGFCTSDPGCYSAWRRWREVHGTGDNGLDRQRFIAWRRERLAEPKAAS